MGGFLYLSKPKGTVIEETEKRHKASLAVFERKGLPLNTRLISEDFGGLCVSQEQVPGGKFCGLR